ncbi:MAG TPA: alkaline phosphatase family protein [Blastocatellia bacterium]|nr:alkaline phosphatase family protein [Blastocatellia bacterium]
MKRQRHSLFFTAAVTISLLLTWVPQPGQAQPQSPSRRAVSRPARGKASEPRLVLMIVVDQFRYDFLERFQDLFGAGGFRRLMNEGAFFINANYDYVPTYTAPGHAAIFTGSVPAQNGIVGNTWYDRESGKVRVMVSDGAARMVTEKGVAAEPGAPSPRVLIGTTIGDQMRLANNFQSKVVAVSQKDRSAVLPGGQRPNGAFWFSNQTGTFVTSDYYVKELPAWVKNFNASQRPDKYFGMKWERALSDHAYDRSQADNLAIQASALGKKFPYTVTGGEQKPGARFYGAFELTPFASEYLADFARAAIEAESLGSDRYTDLLSVSFSTPDLAGHSYGPDSQEVQDIYVRLDRVIADLLSYVDRRVGLANTVVAVTGDHGVAPVPEYMQSRGIDAERLSPAGAIDAANKALAARFGGDKWVVAFVNDQLYLDRKMIADRKADPAEAERVAGDAALAVPGVVSFFTRSQIVEGRMPPSAIARRVMNGFNRLRSGDVWLITKPFSFFLEGTVPIATTHGSPDNYDTHVPVILFGAGVQAGRYGVECTPSDIAPTLAALLGVEQPSNRVGRVLVEAIAAAAARQ